MFTPQVVDLAYIGERATKTDNVCGTGTVWIGFGDIQKVERKHIPVFLKHPDVWMLGDKFKELHGITEQLTGEQVGGAPQNDFGSAGSELWQQSLQQLIGQGAADATVALVGAITPLVDAQVTGGEFKTESAPAIVNVQAGLADANIAPPAETETKPEEERPEKTGEQLAVIKNAILSLEQGNPKHFSTTNGVPVVSAVRNAAGDESITAAEVRTAWAELNGKAE